MAKKVKMDDIARKLGVSKNTVSLALRNMSVISDQTRELVHKTAKEMGYVYAKKNESTEEEESLPKNICLLLPRNIRNIEFFSYIQFAIEREAGKNHLNVILCYLDEDFLNKPPLCIRERIVAGIITLGQFPRTVLASIQAFALPIVVVDMYYDNLVMDYILTDNTSGAYQMTEYLIQKGHNEIGFIGNIRYASSFYDRYQGFVKAMQDHQLGLSREWSITEAFCTHQGLLEHVSAHKDHLPTAVFCVNDNSAVMLIKVLEELMGPMQQKVSVCGFDNISKAEESVPGITTMHVQKELMGETAVQRLLALMKDKATDPRKILLATKLMERESVRSISFIEP